MLKPPYLIRKMGCKMKRKIISGVFSLILIIFLLATGCISDNNEEIPPIPIITYATSANYSNDTLWLEVNVSLSLEREFYVTYSPIETIVSWYENEDNIPGWSIKSSKVSGSPEDPFNVSYGHVKIQNSENGGFIFIKKIEADWHLDGISLIGITNGKWTQIENFGI
jgi:hypothetical protein